MFPAEELMDAPLAIVLAPVFTRVIFPAAVNAPSIVMLLPNKLIGPLIDQAV